MTKIKIFMVALTVLLFNQCRAATINFNKKEIRVVDGDTIVLTKGAFKTRVRLNWIDAPELAQTCLDSDNKEWACGRESALALKQQLDVCDEMSNCFVNLNGNDRYGRSLGTIFINDLNVNKLMVENGMAVAYKEYSRIYETEENSAKARKKGIWQGKFVKPQTYRRSK